MALRHVFSRLAWRRHRPPERIPGFTEGGCRYVAIIMDGNGRWAKQRHLPAVAGHRAGTKSLHKVVDHAIDCGIEELTIFSFSTENWTRPQDEVAALMDLFVEMIEKEVPGLHDEQVRVRFIGRRSEAPPELQRRIAEAEALTAENGRMTLYIAFNYGGRAEILDAASGLAAELAAEQTDLKAEGSEALRRHLYAPEMHDPELLVRTSGEMRISNFLLWQLAYTELYFSPKLWPDFGPDDLDAALADFTRRQRRYGGR
jgi:undecaprenyl diphosphate synthase